MSPLLFQEELEQMVKREHALIDSKDAKKKDKEATPSSRSTGAEAGNSDKTE